MLSDRKSIKSQKKCLTILIDAPDGIPWAISIYRGTSPQEYIKPIAASLGHDTKPEKWGAKFDKLASSIQEIIDDRQFFTLEKEEFYISAGDMKQLFGQTMLRKLIQAQNPIVERSLTIDSHIADSCCYDIDDEDLVDENQDKMRLIQEKLHASSPKLAIQTNGDGLGIIRLRQDRSVLWERYFLAEDLTGLTTAKFYAHIKDNIIAEGSFGEQYTQIRKPGSLQKCSWKFHVQVQELLKMFANMALSLQELHDKGIVHADLKPDNILITKQGMVPIDSLDIKIGEMAQGMTQKYAAPEQIMREGVSAQTDQYAFAIILCELLGGVIYGEEVNFIIPAGGSNSARITMLKNPGVFLDPTTCYVPAAAIPQVRKFLTKCLSFSSTNRHATMNEVAAQINKWIGDYAFTKELECPLYFGQLKKERNDVCFWSFSDTYQ